MADLASTILNGKTKLHAPEHAIREVLVVGGGLAGLSAACALSQQGFRVRLLERRPYVGGRASSYEHPGTGEVIDNCQHLVLGCCTNLRDFYKRIGVANRIQWSNHMTLVEPGGRRTVLRPGPLPAPFHSAISFMAAPMMDFHDKVGVAKAMLKLARELPPDSNEDFATWLEQNKQTPRAIDHLWRPVIVSALNDDIDRVSVRYAAEVFRKSFLNSPQGGTVGLANVPLGEIYVRAIDFIRARNNEVHLRAGAERVQYDAQTRRWRVSTLDNEYPADAIVFAVPFDIMRKMLASMPPTDSQAARTLSSQLEQFQTSPITGIHLWLDREITDLTHAALLDSPVQWMFNKSRMQKGVRSQNGGSYLELVISASRDMVGMSRQQIIDLAMTELPQFFPAAINAKVVKAAVIKEVNATFCVTPGLDAFRPGPFGAWPRVFLAGDYTATGWPSTMESAVRSGYMAAEALCSAAGKSCSFLVPDLPAKGLMRWIDKTPDGEREAYD